MDIGQTATGTIAPKNAAGRAAPLNNVAFTCDTPAYTVAQAADGLSAIYTSAAAGSANALVSGVSVGGVTLNDTKALPDVVEDQEAVSINLSIA